MSASRWRPAVRCCSVRSTRDAAGRLYLLLATGHPETPLWILAELRGEWLWSDLNNVGGRLVVLDSRGEAHFSSQGIPAGTVARAVVHLPGLPGNGAGIDLAWTDDAAAWNGAMARINSASTTSELTLAVMALEREPPWSAAFWSALRKQSPLLLLVGRAGRMAGAWLRRAAAGAPAAAASRGGTAAGSPPHGATHAGASSARCSSWSRPTTAAPRPSRRRTACAACWMNWMHCCCLVVTTKA